MVAQRPRARHEPAPRPWRCAPDVTSLLDGALERGTLSVRGYDRVLRIAWTVTDLRGGTAPTADDVGAAFSLRNPTGLAA
nr:hypothetical protein [Angustibacter aerolatus]